MDLSRTVVERMAEEYRTQAPLFAVEQEQIESLPSAFASGSYGWRDAAWVVRWYYRRHLGGYPDERRRAAEASFGENDFEMVREAIAAAIATPRTAGKLERLTTMTGVDIGVASAFLFFTDPDSHIVVGDREWGALRAVNELEAPTPEPMTATAYETYLSVCRNLGERFDCSMWTLYQVLWRLSAAANERDA